MRNPIGKRALVVSLILVLIAFNTLSSCFHFFGVDRRSLRGSQLSF